MLAESNVGWVYGADDTGWWTLSTLPSSWRTCVHTRTWAVQSSPASLGPLKLQGHWEHKLSLTFMSAMNVTQADRCTIQVSVLQDTLTGEHKLKLFGLIIITEATGQQEEPGWFLCHVLNFQVESWYCLLCKQ